MTLSYYSQRAALNNDNPTKAWSRNLLCTLCKYETTIRAQRVTLSFMKLAPPYYKAPQCITRLDFGDYLERALPGGSSRASE